MRARPLPALRSPTWVAALLGLALGAGVMMNGCGDGTAKPLGTEGAACYGDLKDPCGRCNAQLTCNADNICVKGGFLPASCSADAGGNDAAAGHDGAAGADGGGPDVGADAPATDVGAAGSDGAVDQATDAGADASGDAGDGGDA